MIDSDIENRCESHNDHFNNWRYSSPVYKAGLPSLQGVDVYYTMVDVEGNRATIFRGIFLLVTVKVTTSLDIFIKSLGSRLLFRHGNLKNSSAIRVVFGSDHAVMGSHNFLADGKTQPFAACACLCFA